MNRTCCSPRRSDGQPLAAANAMARPCRQHCACRSPAARLGDPVPRRAAAMRDRGKGSGRSAAESDMTTTSSKTRCRSRHRGRTEAEGVETFEDRLEYKNCGPAGTGYRQPAAERIALASQERKYKKLKDESSSSESLRLNRPASIRWSSSSTTSTKASLRRPPAAPGDTTASRARTFCATTRLGARSALAQPCLETLRQAGRISSTTKGPHQGAAPRDPVAGCLDRARDRRIPQDRARRTEGRARSAPGQEEMVEANLRLVSRSPEYTNRACSSSI